MVAFQSLGALSAHLSEAGVQLMDPGVPLTDATLGVADERAIFENQPSVRKVTGYVARHVSKVPLHVYERVSDTDRKRVTDHPLARALSVPSPGMTAVRFWHDLMIDRLIHDRLCAVWSEDKTTGAVGLQRIPARRTRFRGDGAGRVVRIDVVGTDGRITKLDPASCVYDVGYSPGPGTDAGGVSPIETLRELLEESAEAVQYRRAIWANGARIPHVVKRPSDAPKWRDGARSRFLRGLEAFRKGGGKEGSWLLLEDGMDLVAAPSFRPKDTLDLEGRKLTDVEVASAYFVPPELVGAREGTYSNVDAFRRMLYGDVLGSWFASIEQAVNVHLVRQLEDDRDLYVEFAVEAMMRGSVLEQAKVGQTAVGAPFMTRNEWRGRMNMPEIEGGDELVTPLNVTEGGQASPSDVEGRPAEDSA